MEDQKLKELLAEVSFRDTQFNLLYDLLIKSQSFLYPIIHLFGLSGTGKTFAIKKFMKKCCNVVNLPVSKKQPVQDNRLYVYLNCNELCYASISLLFSEILVQISNALPSINDKEESEDIGVDMDIEIENSSSVDLDTSSNEEMSVHDVRMNDCSTFLRQLKKPLIELQTRRTKRFCTLHLIMLRTLSISVTRVIYC